MKRENIAKISAVIITIALVAILLSQIPIADIITTLAGIDPLYLVVGFVLYVCSYFFRALRFHILLNKEVGIRDLFNIVCVHNMMNNILPARTGELSYIYLLKKKHNKKTGEGIATLAIARAFDFIAISALFFISAITVGELPAVISNAILTIAIFLAIVALFLVISVYKGKGFMQKIEQIASKLNLERFRVIEFLIGKGKETTKSFDVIQSKKVLFYSFLFSIFIWLFQYYVAYILLNALELNLTISLVVLGSTLSFFIIVLPIPSFGGFGVYEVAWTVAFVPLGILKEKAILVGFGIHAIFSFFYLIMGVYGGIKLKFFRFSV